MNGNEEEEKLQVKIQAFEEKININNSTPGSIRRYSLGQVSKEERKDIRFNRYGSVKHVSGFFEYQFCKKSVQTLRNRSTCMMAIGILSLILTKSNVCEFKG